MTSAVDRWRHELEAWTIPQALLDGVPWNPYEWPAHLFARRDRAIADHDLPARHTDEVIRRLAPRTVLDIGAGSGGSCLELAAGGLAVTAIEPDSGMAAKLRASIAERDIPVDLIEMPWPEAATVVDRADVVTASHVVHNIADVAPFLRAMHTTADVAVVLQDFEAHPWAHLGPYYRILHDLDRPAGPTSDLLVEVVGEVLGVDPTVDKWDGGRPMWFNDRQELFEFYGRRLVVPPQRWHELEAVLGPDIVELDGGRVQLADRQKRLVTMWWKV